MSNVANNLSQIKGEIPDGSSYKIGIVVSPYYEKIASSLLEACLSYLEKAKVAIENIKVVYAPGTFELPLACKLLNDSSHYDAIIAIGCVIKGDTDHDKYINTSVAHALQLLSLKYRKPFVFGILTPNSYTQAADRAGGKHGNKGVEIAMAALQMIAFQRNLNPKK